MLTFIVHCSYPVLRLNIEFLKNSLSPRLNSQVYRSSSMRDIPNQSWDNVSDILIDARLVFSKVPHAISMLAFTKYEAHGLIHNRILVGNYCIGRLVEHIPT